MSRTIFVFLVTLIVSGLSFGQNIKLKGSGGFIGGTVNVKKDIDNTSATGTYYFSGTVNLTGTAAVQNIGGSGEDDSLTFANLYANGTQDVDLQVGTTVYSDFDVTGGGAFNVNALTLNFGGTTAITSGTFDASNVSSVVNYTSGSAQTVLASSYGGTLALSGAGAKSLGGASSAAIVSHAGGAFTIGSTLDVNGSSASALDAVTVTSTLTHSGSNTLTIATVSDLTGGTITNTSSGTTAFTNAVNTGTGTVNASSGALTFADNLDVDNASGAFTLSGSATSTFSANVANSGSGTVTFGGTSTAIYNNASASTDQGVLAASYYNLTINGASDTTYTVAGAKVAGGAITIGAGGALTIAALNVLDMGSNSLTLTGSGSLASSAKIKWAGSNTFVAGSGVTEFYNASAGTVAANTGYGILWFTGSGTKTISGTVTAGPGSGSGTGVLVADNLDVSGGTLTVNGDLDVEATGSVTNTGTITVQ